MAGVNEHERIGRALARYAELDAGDYAAIGKIDIEVRELAPSTYLVREGQAPRRCALMLDGYVFRQKLTIEGNRTIVALRVPGDFVDLQNIFFTESDHDVVCMAQAVVLDMAIDDLRALARERPNINQALWMIGLTEASILREWLQNVARRDAQTRMAHLLCEFSTRLVHSGLDRQLTYELPMTQEQLGDALGLTSVHVNRVLKALEQEGLIRRRKREVVIADWERLRRVAAFNERYLHLSDMRD